MNSVFEAIGFKFLKFLLTSIFLFHEEGKNDMNLTFPQYRKMAVFLSCMYVHVYVCVYMCIFVCMFCLFPSHHC